VIGEFLYTLGERDQKITPLDIFIDRRTITGATAPNLAFSLPIDRVLILQSYSVSFLPGAINSAVSGSLKFFRNGNSSNFHDGDIEVFSTVAGVSGDDPTWNLAVDQKVTFHSTIEIIIPPGGRLMFTGVFTTPGGATNVIDATIMGLMIPRGNFAF